MSESLPPPLIHALATIPPFIKYKVVKWGFAEILNKWSVSFYGDGKIIFDLNFLVNQTTH